MGWRDLMAWLLGGGQPTGEPQPPLPPPQVGRGLDDLAQRLGVAATWLQNVPLEYRAFTVPKRSGKPRTILAPGDELKKLQRLLLRRVLRGLPVHPAAMGFERGRSIVDNALPHVGQAVVIRLDIQDFFGSIKAARVERYFRFIGWNAQAAAALTRLCTYNGALPQGAPTSPKLSNLVNYRLDLRLDGLARCAVTRSNPKASQAVGSSAPVGSYSRYADDITFSFPADTELRPNGVIYLAKRVLQNEGYRLHTHRKLRIMRAHQQQRVTGLVVNRGVNLPRRARRRLRAIAHHLACGRSATLSAQQLAGWWALQSMITRPPLAMDDSPGGSS